LKSPDKHRLNKKTKEEVAGAKVCLGQKIVPLSEQQMAKINNNNNNTNKHTRAY
jgi:hypothetical protein